MAGPNDTHPDVAKLQLELLRQATPARRFAIQSTLSKTLMQASYRQVLKRVGDEKKAKLEWVRICYGPDVAERLEKCL